MKVHESESRFEDPMFALINPDVFQYDQGQHQRKRVARRKQWQERKQRAIRLRDKWENLKHNGKTVFERKVRRTRMERRIREARRLEHWVNSSYDFGTSWAEEEAETADVDCQAEGLRNIKVAIASASSPGAPASGAPLKHRQVESPIHLETADLHIPQAEEAFDIDTLLDAESELLDTTGPGGAEQPEIDVDVDTSVFTRMTDPMKAKRVSEILRSIEIGDDLTTEERQRVKDIVAEFADVFALSVSEVKHIPGASHRLDVPEDATLNTRIGQRRMTPPQAEYFAKALDIMIDAGVVASIAAKDVKCVSPITMAAKAHTVAGMTLDELKQCLNWECEQALLGKPFVRSDGESPSMPMSGDGPAKPAKWQVCTNYKELNKVTQVLPMPQGDIRTKQQAVSGHRWVSLFDFAAGFYAVEIAEESRPYTAFYVEGRGYFVYCRMPFGLTGAPSCFNEVTGKALHGLVGTIMQLFVDDGAMAGDVFEDKLSNLCTFFVRCREESLSLSPQKTKLFMTEVVFAGERVGQMGIRGDLAKLIAVVNWPTPTTIQNLEAFLGLTGYFRPLIKNYSLLEKPLKDLANTLEVPKGAGKKAYQNAA